MAVTQEHRAGVSNRMKDARITKEQVPHIYSKIASIYDLWALLTERKARNRCLELAAVQDGEDVLEVAVGTGLAFVEILKANPSGRNEGVDLTAAMLALAEKKARRTGIDSYRLQVGDAYRLKFPDDSFDALINNYMFDLLPERDFRTVLEEFKRVLRPGGRLAMVNMTEGTRWYNGVWGRLYQFSPALLGGCRPVSVLPLMRQCGYQQTTREYFSQFTFPSEVIVGVAP
jgi:ubiquinone/menaquinone biosynthesis C-methylase UbiE